MAIEAQIRLLPESLANQIAAGEVVQRPASVVKELLENAVDAGAKNIRLITKQAGKQLIQVVDDGIGMNEQDARMCFERHATSKIKKSEDLFQIMTLGFRGEALASIAAVARVELLTKQEDDELGLKLHMEGGHLKKTEPAQAKPGTSISVSQLFFNVPARRKFLKSDKAESHHILDEFHRVALAHPDIGFQYAQDGKEIYLLPAEKLGKRIVGLFGKSYEGNLIPVKEETEAFKLHGYIGTPEMARKSKPFYFLMANGRYIKHAYLNHAVKMAFENILADGKQPFYVLFLHLDPEKMDVNVHPTKTEVKFEDEQQLYGLMKSAVRASLNQHNLLPSIDFTQNVADEYFLNLRPRGSGRPPSEGKPHPWPKEAQSDRLSQGERSAYLENFNALHRRQQVENEEQARWAKALQEGSLGQSDSPVQDDQALPDTFLLAGPFALAAVPPRGFWAYHLAGIRERVVYEQVLEQYAKGGAHSQQLMFAETHEMSALEVQELKTGQTQVEALGFSLSFPSAKAVEVGGVPIFLGKASVRAVLESIAHELTSDETPHLPKAERLARIVAGKAAAAQSTYTEAEVRQLLEDLAHCSIQQYGPNGQRLKLFLGQEALGKLFA